MNYQKKKKGFPLHHHNVLLFIINSLFVMYVYHAPTCTAKKIRENQRKEMYDMFKTTILMIYF